jgi:hypothetical protein
MTLAAERVATTSAGNELEAPTATASPRLAPASWKRETTKPAKFGFVVVLFASSRPADVVMADASSPMRPVPFGSIARSIVTPRVSRQSLIVAPAAAINREASVISVRRAASGKGRNRTRRK